MRPRREAVRGAEYSYFVTSQTKGRTPIFRHERWAGLMVSVLHHYDGFRYKLHAYVVMPDHVHALLTPFEAVERSVQMIKGGFSFRAKRELAWTGEIWQPGFSDHRIRDQEDWHQHVGYIRSNPVRARLVEASALFEYMGFPDIEVPQGLKPRVLANSDVRAKARTLQRQVAGAEASALRGRVAGAEGGTLQRQATIVAAEDDISHTSEGLVKKCNVKL